jgi:adenosyl cobinamide kinase/adenosyl cobinamide phosphate guanylyltransferase
MYTFVTGGYRSGRSNYALRRASELGTPPWFYVSSGQEPDEAVRKRIEHHRRDVEAIWRTAVLPARLADLLGPEALKDCGAAVLDGLAEWMGDRLKAGVTEAALLQDVAGFTDRIYRATVPLVLTSTELGMGMIPRDDNENRLMRVVTMANQLLAQQAGAVVLMVSGVPIRVR